MLDKELKWINS